MRRPLTLPALTLSSLLFLAASARAADVQVVFPVSGKYVVFGADSVPDAVPADALHVQGKTATVPASGSIAFIGDERSGRIVSTSWDALAKKTPIDFKKATHLMAVSVRVTSGGASVPGAKATWEDDEGTNQGVATDNVIGGLDFTMVRLGAAKIDVTYVGKDGKERVQHNQVQVADSSPITLDVAGAAIGAEPSAAPPAVAAPSSAITPTAASAPPAPSGGSVIGNILSTLIGLGVVAGLAYAAWRYARANPDKVSDALTKIGADVPKPLDPDPPATTPSATPAVAVPSGPIILDPATEPITLPSTPIALTSAPTGVPKLVGADGSAFDLPEGETVVGREALGGLMIAHETVSRQHARLVRSGSAVTVEDLGSTNGTWVNDAPTPAALVGGETVRFGQVSYRFEG